MKQGIEITLIILLAALAVGLFRIFLLHARHRLWWSSIKFGFFAITSAVGAILTALDMTGAISLAEWRTAAGA